MIVQPGSYAPRFNVVLHQPEIPGNTGAVGRTCVAFQAKLWLVRPLGFQLDEKKLRRAGLDYWPHLSFEIADHWEDLTGKLGETRIWKFTRFATKEIGNVEFESGDTLVFGSETSGLPKSMTETDPDSSLKIPTTEFVRSLNLASSVAISAFEVSRQLQASHPE